MTNLNELYRAYRKQCEENITAEKQFRNEKFWAKESTLKSFYITKWKLCVILVYSRCEQTHYTISRVIYNLIKASVNFHLFFHSLCFVFVLQRRQDLVCVGIGLACKLLVVDCKNSQSLLLIVYFTLTTHCH